MAKTGQEYPHKGWWGQPDSLNIEVFDILPFPEVYESFKMNSEDPNTLTVLLTNRIPKLMPSVMRLLEIHDISFDSYSFKTSEKNKKERILEFLERYPDVTEIVVHDDQDDQIAILMELKTIVDKKIKVNVLQVIEGELQLL
ncbi:MAG: hypothetical protein HC836_45480 [Richelia sp. RM2_1_2]|nr:hypothetical protein [Richelia sp. RM2_1_2]